VSWLRGHLEQVRVVAILRAPVIAAPERVAATLVAAGVPTIELTFTTPDVQALIEAMAAVDGAVVAAGSVTTSLQACEAYEAGARFVVSPGYEPEVAATCRASGIPYVPGAMTPTEIRAAVRDGWDVVKLFPARPLGPAFVRDVLAPFPDLALVPSGGIGIDDVDEYLRAGAVAVGTGAVATPALLASGDLDALRERAVALARAVGLPRE
jgi:2-dehydro-3-deoxyphosphogluconate aldolase/(4S)-4-hydroxy-2-oxoglutarate aldolase